MKTIPAKQKIFEKEPTVQCGDLAAQRDWMASFLDFQISQFAERCVEIREGIDAKLSVIDRDRIWN